MGLEAVYKDKLIFLDSSSCSVSGSTGTFLLELFGHQVPINHSFPPRRSICMVDESAWPWDRRSWVHWHVSHQWHQHCNTGILHVNVDLWHLHLHCFIRLIHCYQFLIWNHDVWSSFTFFFLHVLQEEKRVTHKADETGAPPIVIETQLGLEDQMGELAAIVVEKRRILSLL